MVSIHIIGVPKRADMIARLSKKTKADAIHLDEEYRGNVLWTEKLAWLAPVQPNETHRCVLMDDVDVCKNFRKILEKMVKRYPTAIFSLFPYAYQQRSIVADKLTDDPNPYVRTIDISDCALLMPVCYIDEIYKDAPDDADAEAIVLEFIRKNDIPFYTTLPATVQHIGMESTLDTSTGYHGADIRTPYFWTDVSGFTW